MIKQRPLIRLGGFGELFCVDKDDFIDTYHDVRHGGQPSPGDIDQRRSYEYIAARHLLEERQRAGQAPKTKPGKETSVAASFLDIPDDINPNII